MKKVLVFVVFAILMVTMVGCAPGEDIEIETPATTIRLTMPNPNPLANEPDADNRISGFIEGLWHGIIAPVTLILSFFNEAIEMYEVHNDGRPYNLGYLLGIAVVFSILGVAGGRRR